LAEILPIARDLADAKEQARALITLAPLIGGDAGRALVDVAVEALPTMNRG
jgi:hypothetical protein